MEKNEILGIYLTRFRVKNELANDVEDDAICFIGDENGAWVPWREVEALIEKIKSQK